MVCPSGVNAIGSNMPGLVSTVPPAVKLPWVLRTIGFPPSALLGSFSSALTGMEKIDAAVAASTTLVRNAGLNPRSGAFFARTSSSCFMFSSRKRIAIGRSSCSGPEWRQLLEARRHRLIGQPQSPGVSARCAAAIRPELEIDRTRRGHRENDANDPERMCAEAALIVIYKIPSGHTGVPRTETPSGATSSIRTDAARLSHELISCAD